MRLLFASAGVLLLGGAAFLVAWPRAGGRDERRPPAAVTARTTVERKAEPASPPPAPFIGVVYPRLAADISAPAAGSLHSVRVAVGQRVRRDEVMAVIAERPTGDDVATAQAEVAAAVARRDIATNELARADETAAKTEKLARFVTEDELSTARLGVRLATSRLEAARADLARAEASLRGLVQARASATLRAPFDGVVSRIYLDAGAVVDRGAPVLRIVGDDTPRVRFAVPEARAADVRQGDPITVTSPATRASLSGRVEYVTPEIDVAAGVLIAEASLDTPGSATVLLGARVDVVSLRRP